MSKFSYPAPFASADSPERICEGLACPVCGRQDPHAAERQVVDGKLRILCDGCGACITFVLSDEQARAIESCRG
jgi:hypothetical protein